MPTRRTGLVATAACVTACGVLSGTPTLVAGQAIPAGASPSVLFDVRQEGTSAGHPRWLPPVASLLVPGTGQFLTGTSRGAVYLVAEVFLVATYVSAQSAGRSHRDTFHGLAFDVARAPFDPTIPDTAFQYYEQMEEFVASGPFDADSRPGLQPATDESTFNGSIWALARRNSFADPDVVPDPTSPEYQRALEFYRRRAVGPNFLWSWQGAAFEHDLFTQAVSRSNDAFRRGSTALGFLLANHLVSALDAFISGRLSTASRATTLQTRVLNRDRYGLGPGFEWIVSVAF